MFSFLAPAISAICSNNSQYKFLNFSNSTLYHSIECSYNEKKKIFENLLISYAKMELYKINNVKSVNEILKLTTEAISSSMWLL
jgi:hypothetical protein